MGEGGRARVCLLLGESDSESCRNCLYLERERERQIDEVGMNRWRR